MIADKVAIAEKWISQGYGIRLVLGFVGLPLSTYYAFRTRRTQEKSEPQEGDTSSKELKRSGRPESTYSLTREGRKIFDEEIKEYLTELVCREGFPYGYRKLTVCLREDYGLIINHKKVYRLCKELDTLLPQRKVIREKPRVLAKREAVTAPNQLWEMDVKYGYILGTNQFFFQLSLLDVFDRMIIDYHIGLSCTAVDASRVLKNGLKKRGLYKGVKVPRLRTDNGPQFIAKKFQETCEKLGIIHERIPVKTPNLNAHIEAFHSILENECYGRHEFESFMEVYAEVSRYVEYYNQRRRHGSLGYMVPEEFHKAFMRKLMNAESFVA